ncbi:MAG TPA: AAA family ATPase, partial [Gallicola sp.]|nr:AAA family ATPase [Gallicola sp.]
TETMKSINEEIVKQHGNITQKKLSIAMDVSSKSSWGANITSYLDEIPFAYIGKGEQNKIKTMISLNKNNDCHVILIEEPENHLSFSNMTKLISDISTACSEKQLIITTHSTFVLNKLGIKNVLILCNDIITPLSDLSVDTQKYFQKLPGFNTLRIILSKCPILVEGPADDLVLQKAYLLKNNKLPLDDGVDIIVMNGLAFKRFLDIAMLVNKKIKVIRDNDGKDIQKIEANYKKYIEGGNLEIYCDSDPVVDTLEPQLLKYNDISILNKIFGQDCKTDEEILYYMKRNKTECALKIFETTEKINIPEYITDAIK